VRHTHKIFRNNDYNKKTQHNNILKSQQAYTLNRNKTQQKNTVKKTIFLQFPKSIQDQTDF
jgi:hypothetical protein